MKRGGELYQFFDGLSFKYGLFLVSLWLTASTVQAQFFQFGPPPVSTNRSVVPPVEPAKFKGGRQGLNRTLEREFRRVDGHSKTDGIILIIGIINEKGKVVDTQVLRSLNSALDKEALRVVHKLKFKPARQNKKKIKSRIEITFPIRHGRVSFSTLKTVDV